ncbi:MAG: ATP-dependent DNA ligase [Streptosporangiaceae bacterium]
MLLAHIAEASADVAASSARLEKVARLAECLRQARPDDVEIVVAFLSGEPRQRQIGVGYAAFRDVPGAAAAATLTVREVDEAFARMESLSGPGSQRQRRQQLTDLLGRATGAEQGFLIPLMVGELRQGALDAVMVEAVARAADVRADAVRQAVMLRGALGPVAQAVLRHGAAGLAAFRLEVGRPLRPMLAQSADTIDAAFERICPAAVEWKLDGVRMQVHRDGSDVRVFSRSLDDITARVPEVAEAALALPVRAIVLDGEVLALGDDGRPYPFQVTSGRVSNRRDVEAVRTSHPLTPFVFDILHADGDDLLGRPGRERYAVLARFAPDGLRTPRVVTDDAEDARDFFRDATAREHEGVVVKSLDTPYVAGRRGAGWIKVKPRHTLDLVVLAAEWGHGRRRGWLSNVHLGTRDESGGHVMLGKTFKGMTDAMLAWQTERLLALEVSRDSWIVYVRPELVVEVAFDGVQTSPRYPGGLALRFARVLRYREDKRPDEADTIDTVRAISGG